MHLLPFWDSRRATTLKEKVHCHHGAGVGLVEWGPGGRLEGGFREFTSTPAWHRETRKGCRS